MAVNGASDEQLWGAFVRADDSALETLVDRYSSGLYWYLLLSTGNQQAAAQQAVSIWELVACYRRPFEGFGSFKSWLYAVATQNAVPAARREDLGLSGLLDDMRRSAQVSGKARTFFGIRDMVRSIRQPFLLVAVAGLTVEDAAKACNFSEERTVRSIEMACRQLGRARLSGGGGDEL